MHQNFQETQKTSLHSRKEFKRYRYLRHLPRMRYLPVYLSPIIIRFFSLFHSIYNLLSRLNQGNIVQGEGAIESITFKDIVAGTDLTKAQWLKEILDEKQDQNNKIRIVSICEELKDNYEQIGRILNKNLQLPTKKIGSKIKMQIQI